MNNTLNTNPNNPRIARLIKEVEAASRELKRAYDELEAREYDPAFWFAEKLHGLGWELTYGYCCSMCGEDVYRLHWIGKGWAEGVTCSYQVDYQAEHLADLSFFRNVKNRKDVGRYLMQLVEEKGTRIAVDLDLTQDIVDRAQSSLDELRKERDAGVGIGKEVNIEWGVLDLEHTKLGLTLPSDMPRDMRAALCRELTRNPELSWTRLKVETAERRVPSDDEKLAARLQAEFRETYRAALKAGSASIMRIWREVMERNGLILDDRERLGLS